MPQAVSFFYNKKIKLMFFLQKLSYRKIITIDAGRFCFVVNFFKCFFKFNTCLCYMKKIKINFFFLSFRSELAKSDIRVFF